MRACVRVCVVFDDVWLSNFYSAGRVCKVITAYVKPCRVCQTCRCYAASHRSSSDAHEWITSRVLEGSVSLSEILNTLLIAQTLFVNTPLSSALSFVVTPCVSVQMLL